MLSKEKVDEIMNGIENKIRHAYNCGYSDGCHDMRMKFTKDIQTSIEEVVKNMLEPKEGDQ